MSTATSVEREVDSEAESADLASFGYTQQLHRRLGSYASFAAGFSFVSILTTVFQLFAFGFSFGGPAFFWTWPLVFVGQFLVALNFSELAARYPISGAIYQWSSRLSNVTVGWFAGWIMIIAQIVTTAVAAIAMQIVLPPIWDGFQLVGTDSSPVSADGAANAVLLGVIVLCFTTVINVIGVRLMAVINSAGVTLELIGVVVVVVLLFAHAERGPGVLTDTGGLGSGTGYVGAFLVSSLMAAYVMVGFDSAGELSEETRDPRHTAPRTILRALVVSGIGGAFLLIAALVAAPSLTDGTLATQGLPYVLTSRLGDTGGRLLLVLVAIAVFVCTLSIQTAGSRMVFSMARDGVLPFSRTLSWIPERTGTPAVASIVVGVLAAGVLVVNIHQGSLFLALSSVCIVMLYLAYLFVTIPLLLRRLKGWPAGLAEFTTDSGGKLFSLGRWGIAVNAGAVLYGLAMMTNLGWPRAAVYNPFDGAAYLQWLAPLFVAASLAVGALVYARFRVRIQSLAGGPAPVVVPETLPTTAAA
ncbi:MAG TPA: amino acid permease [Kineosporiaceae bacterium]|nr:amino acid permease [Kineosporiaceae bacterium]